MEFYHLVGIGLILKTHNLSKTYQTSHKIIASHPIYFWSGLVNSMNLISLPSAIVPPPFPWKKIKIDWWQSIWSIGVYRPAVCTYCIRFYPVIKLLACHLVCVKTWSFVTVSIASWWKPCGMFQMSMLTYCLSAWGRMLYCLTRVSEFHITILCLVWNGQPERNNLYSRDHVILHFDSQST